MQAVIVAGGAGTRLRPLTYNRPKPMVPLFDKPFLQYQVELLRRYGIKDIVINVHYLAKEIMEYFGDGSALGVSIRYSEEQTALGTAGAVKKAEPLLSNEPLMVMNADILTDFDLGAMLRFHQEKQATVTVSLIPVEDPSAFGLAVLDENGRVLRYLEKPTQDEATDLGSPAGHHLINAGFYIMDPSVLRFMPINEAYSFERGLFPLLLQLKEAFYGVEMRGYWLDIGNPERYIQAHNDILSERVKVEMNAERRDGNIWVAEGADLDPSAELRGPLYIGSRVRVRKRARVMEYAVLCSDVIVDDRALVESSIIGAGTTIGEDAKVRRSLVGGDCTINEHVQLEGALIADNSQVAKGSRLGTLSLLS